MESASASETKPVSFELLGLGHLTEVKSVLVDAYRHERTFQGLFEANRDGFEQRLRAFVREYCLQHFDQRQSVVGARLDGRLVGVALLCEPSHQGALNASRRARLGLALTVGIRCAKRYLTYQDQLRAVMPDSPWCYLPLVGVLESHRGLGVGAGLLNDVWSRVERIPGATGIALGSGAAAAASFYQNLGFEPVGQMAFEGTVETLFYRAT